MDRPANAAIRPQRKAQCGVSSPARVGAHNGSTRKSVKRTALAWKMSMFGRLMTKLPWRPSSPWPCSSVTTRMMLEFRSSLERARSAAGDPARREAATRDGLRCQGVAILACLHLQSACSHRCLNYGSPRCSAKSRTRARTLGREGNRRALKCEWESQISWRRRSVSPKRSSGTPIRSISDRYRLQARRLSSPAFK